MSVIKMMGLGDDALSGVAFNRSMFESAFCEFLFDGDGVCVEFYEESKLSGMWMCVKLVLLGKL